MALNYLDIRKLTAHHYIGKSFPEFVVDKVVNKKISISDIGKSEINTYLGTPYFMDMYCTIPGSPRVRLPHEPLIRFSLRKNIVKTVTTGGKRTGTVKEYISSDDYRIEFRGVCVDAHNPLRYPSEQVEIIKKLSHTNEAIEVSNDILRFFGIYKMVIESVSFSDMVGVPGAQAYQIRALNDEDFYASYKEKNQFLNS